MLLNPYHDKFGFECQTILWMENYRHTQHDILIGDQSLTSNQQCSYDYDTLYLVFHNIIHSQTIDM